MAQNLLSKVLPKLAVGAAAVISAFGILKVLEFGKNIGVAAAIQELTNKKDEMLADIKKDQELHRSKVTKMYASLDKDHQTFFTNWSLEAVKANPDKAKKIVDELAKVEFPLAGKIKVATDWAGTKLLAPVVGFLGEEASKLLQPATKTDSPSPLSSPAAAQEST